MFHHVSVGVNDIQKAASFYDVVMAELDYERLFGNESEGFVAYGPEGNFFIICEPLDETRPAGGGSNGSHFCFNAPSKEAVNGFYKKALEYGAQSDGAPGIRENYAKDYYAAYILDLDGHKIEAMTRVKT